MSGEHGCPNTVVIQYYQWKIRSETETGNWTGCKPLALLNQYPHTIQVVCLHISWTPASNPAKYGFEGALFTQYTVLCGHTIFLYSLSTRWWSRRGADIQWFGLQSPWHQLHLCTHTASSHGTHTTPRWRFARQYSTVLYLLCRVAYVLPQNTIAEHS